jgi:hypothetical protein
MAGPKATATTKANAANEPTPEPISPKGLPLSPDAMLTALGVTRDEEGRIVRYVEKSTGRIVVVDSEEYDEVEVEKRFVAPPGMKIGEARLEHLDFYDPTLGWMRDGRKREKEHPDNLGHGESVRRTKLVKRQRAETPSEE